MKIIAIGDIHGRTIWKNIVDKEKDADKIVFVGDYFDSHEKISAAEQIHNFKEILTLKRENMDKVIILTGNHDYHYMRGVSETYSGFQSINAFDIREIIQIALNEELIQMCYVNDKYVFTHAGVTKTWSRVNNIDEMDLENSINELFKHKLTPFRFTSGEYYSNIGDDITQPPIWVRPKSLLNDMIDGVICVVGHTSLYELTIKDNIILIDTLGTSQEYLTINNGVAEVSKL